MSRIRSLFERRSKPAKPAGYGQPGYGGWSSGMVWQPGRSDFAVPSQAQRLSAVWACQRLITDAISTLPLDTFQRRDGIRLPYRPRPVWLTFLPGSQHTRIQFLSGVIMSLLCDGNAFAAMVRDRYGAVVDLVILDPNKVEVVRDNHGRKTFKVGNETYDHTEILHVMGRAMPGADRGMSPIAYARDVIESAVSAQEFGLSHFERSAVPPAVIEVPSESTGKGAQGQADIARATEIAKTWHATHGGTQNAGKVGVLIGGAKLSTISTSPADSQWLESRQFSIQEIARIYGVPPHLLADSSNSTSWGSGLAEQTSAFVIYCLRPWVERIEEALTSLLIMDGHGEAFTKLNLDAVLRADIATRYKMHDMAIRNHSMTVDEVRAYEDMPPVPWGNEPQNYNPAQQPMAGVEGDEA